MERDATYAGMIPVALKLALLIWSILKLSGSDFLSEKSFGIVCPENKAFGVPHDVCTRYQHDVNISNILFTHPSHKLVSG